MNANYYIADKQIYGPKGSTGYYLSGDDPQYVFNYNGKTQYYIEKDTIYGPYGDTQYYIASNGYIFGPSKGLPWSSGDE